MSPAGAPGVPVLPGAPGAPGAPAGPGTGTGTATGAGAGTLTTGAGVTTVGLSHALKESASATAENIIEYFMKIPFDGLTKNGSAEGLWAPRVATRRPLYLHAIQLICTHIPASIL